MLCKKPYSKGNRLYGCGQCLPCRINRQRLWTHRLMLETLTSNHSYFLTLTYDPDHLPESGVQKRHLQLYLKRLRKYYRLRYYAVGEYGSKTQRPHYHLALWSDSPFDSDLIHRLWGQGHIVLGDLTPDSSSYVAGYVTKKLTKPDDMIKMGLGHLEPEFSLMSTKPGIGYKSMEQLSETFTRPAKLCSHWLRLVMYLKCYVMDLKHTLLDDIYALNYVSSSMSLNHTLRASRYRKQKPPCWICSKISRIARVLRSRVWRRT